MNKNDLKEKVDRTIEVLAPLALSSTIIKIAKILRLIENDRIKTEMETLCKEYDMTSFDKTEENESGDFTVTITFKKKIGE